MPRRARPAKTTAEPPLPRLCASEVVVVGVDPGLNGGVAAIHGNRVLGTARMPLWEYDGLEWVDGQELRSLFDGWRRHGPVHFWVERCFGQARRSTGPEFRFGSCYGAVLGELAGAVGCVHAVPYSKWQETILPGVSGRKNLKAASVAWAKRRWPAADLKPGRCTSPHDGIADALALATYGQAMLTGTLHLHDAPPEPTVRRGPVHYR